jgi:hypothetical protein
MKRIVAIAITASALLAGPDMGTLIDYDAQDDYIAQTEEAEQYIPAPIVTPIVTAPIIVAPMVTKKSCCSNRDSVDLMAGYNFTEDSGALDDAATVGIRYNKNIAPNTYIQLGYDRVFNADYRNHGRKGDRDSRSVSGDGNHDDSANFGNRGSSDSSDYVSSSSQSSSTQLDRFYLNGLYEFCGDSKLTPYLLAGLGYENVRHEAHNLESGGFFDAGAGLKYQLNEDLNLITEARALKRFDNDDVDIIAGIGLGMMFGEVASQIIPMQEVEIVNNNQIPSIIPSTQVISKTTYKQASHPPAPSSAYDNLDVVPIEAQHSFHTRTVLNERARYNSNTISNSGNYYIQIAALFNSNGENSTYDRKLDAIGLNHQIKNTTIRGRDISLLLVGPYSSSADARADLSKAKRVERGAFIKKING